MCLRVDAGVVHVCVCVRLCILRARGNCHVSLCPFEQLRLFQWFVGRLDFEHADSSVGTSVKERVIDTGEVASSDTVELEEAQCIALHLISASFMCVYSYKNIE